MNGAFAAFSAVQSFLILIAVVAIVGLGVFEAINDDRQRP